MTTAPVQFGIGIKQAFRPNDEMELLKGLEAAIDYCLTQRRVFAVFDWGDDYCQLFLDEDHDMHVESSYGALAEHAGFRTPVEGFSWLRRNYLPASWHARARMAAAAMTRAFIDAGKMTFPAMLSVDILPTDYEPTTPDPSS